VRIAREVRCVLRQPHLIQPEAPNRGSAAAPLSASAVSQHDNRKGNDCWDKPDYRADAAHPQPDPQEIRRSWGIRRWQTMGRCLLKFLGMAHALVVADECIPGNPRTTAQAHESEHDGEEPNEVGHWMRRQP